jgi:hypothetical protein
VSFDICHHCGPSFWDYVLVGIAWAAPMICAAIRRHVGPQSPQGRSILPAIWMLTAWALLVSLRFVTL